MVIVTINNSYSRVTGLDVAQEKKLKDKLSYVVGGKSAYFSRFGPRRKSLMDKRGEFPTGLLHRVVLFLKKNQINFSVKDLRRVP